MPDLVPRTAAAPTDLFRVARRTGGLRYSEIEPTDAGLAHSGNRYDVPGGGVLYAATEVGTCFAETLARFRPSPKIREIVKSERAIFRGTNVFERSRRTIDPADAEFSATIDMWGLRAS